ncbi:MAG TPA: hypothetical protein VLE89_02605 [Chlamydiales bacterium]|nr:hypothetical protein [Chlamydiales bacterium]
MKKLLYTARLKPGVHAAYRLFAAEITGPRKQEYTSLLKRYGLKSTKVWYQTFGDREYAMIFHEAQDDALDRLKTWSSSTHPFDLWFGKQLANFYETAPELAHVFFEFDPHQ